MASTEAEATRTDERATDLFAKEREKSNKMPGPVIEEIISHKTESYVALFGHPLHAQTVHFPIALAFATLGADVFYWYSADPFWMRAGLWAAGFAFVSALAAALFGTAELLLVRGIRIRVASWNHAIAAITLVAILGMNWGVRFNDIEDTLPHGLVLSILAAVFTGLAGWHGGKLVYDHGIGVIVNSSTSSKK
jgi:uncharacterized membrane protein